MAAKTQRPEFKRGDLRLLVPARGAAGKACLIQGKYPADETIALSGDDLYWLVVVAGPAMIAALGGPLDARGIERVGVPPAPAKEKPDAGT